jgi:hypothetical protein
VPGLDPGTHATAYGEAAPWVARSITAPVTVLRTFAEEIMPAFDQPPMALAQV